MHSFVHLSVFFLLVPFFFFLKEKTDHLVKNIFLRDHLRYLATWIAKEKKVKRGTEGEKKTFRKSLKAGERLRPTLPLATAQTSSSSPPLQLADPWEAQSGWPRPPLANLGTLLETCRLKTNQLPPQGLVCSSFFLSCQNLISCF
jgi:hypothetical protein